MRIADSGIGLSGLRLSRFSYDFSSRIFPAWIHVHKLIANQVSDNVTQTQTSTFLDILWKRLIDWSNFKLWFIECWRLHFWNWLLFGSLKAIEELLIPGILYRPFVRCLFPTAIDEFFDQKQKTRSRLGARFTTGPLSRQSRNNLREDEEGSWTAAADGVALKHLTCENICYNHAQLNVIWVNSIGSNGMFHAKQFVVSKLR